MATSSTGVTKYGDVVYFAPDPYFHVDSIQIEKENHYDGGSHESKVHGPFPRGIAPEIHVRYDPTEEEKEKAM